MSQRPRIGFACAYTPLPLLHAAGGVPYRILPMGDAPDLDPADPFVGMAERALSIPLVGPVSWRIDPRSFAEGQLRTRLEAFVEMLNN